MIWKLNGDERENHVIEQTLVRCTFPFDWLMPSLQREGKQTVPVDWEDLARYNQREVVRAGSDGGDGGHSHIHEGDMTAHPIERVIEGRKRVLGLFYLPPYTRIVIDSQLVTDPDLAGEVFLCEAAHAVDYHYMNAEHRRAVVNALHDQDLPPDADVRDGATFNLDGHVCSWFDVGPYEDWVGEAFMETFVEAFSNIPTTMSLSHPTGPDQARLIRGVLLGESVVVDEGGSIEPQESVQSSPEVVALATQLRRFTKTRQAPRYLRDAFAKAEVFLK